MICSQAAIAISHARLRGRLERLRQEAIAGVRDGKLPADVIAVMKNLPLSRSDVRAIKKAL